MEGGTIIDDKAFIYDVCIYKAPKIVLKNISKMRYIKVFTHNLRSFVCWQLCNFEFILLLLELKT